MIERALLQRCAPRLLALACAAGLGCTGFAVPWKPIIKPEQPLSFETPVQLMPPENLRASATPERQIVLSWDPVLVGDVQGYAVMRSTEPGGGFQLVGRTQSRFGTVYVDGNAETGNLGDGQTYFYRVLPFDRNRHVSRSHAYLSAATEPRPDKPVGLRAYSNLPRKVVLYWEPSDRIAVTGYALDRSPTAAGPWERIAFVKGRLQTTYEDPVPGDLRVLYYRLSAVNRYSGESDPTDGVRAVTKAEPLPPIDLAVAEARLGEIELRWAPNVEGDLTHYEIWRAKASGEGAWATEAKLDQVAGDVQGFRDSTVGCGERVRYRVRAHDRDGLISDFSVPLETAGPDLGLRLEAGASGRRLAWDAARAAGWPVAKVYATRSPLPDALLGTVEGKAHLDLPAEAADAKGFAVVLERPASGAASAASAPRCTLVPAP